MAKSKVSFRDQLAAKIKDLGEVEVDKFSDNSGSWINLKVGSKNVLEISFDSKGERITDITFWEEVIQVVDHKKIWSTNE